MGLAGFCSCFQGQSQFDACGVGWLLRATRQKLTDGGIRALCVAAQTEEKKKRGKTGVKTVRQPQTGMCAAG